MDDFSFFQVSSHFSSFLETNDKQDTSNYTFTHRSATMVIPCLSITTIHSITNPPVDLTSYLIHQRSSHSTPNDTVVLLQPHFHLQKEWCSAEERIWQRSLRGQMKYALSVASQQVMMSNWRIVHATSWNIAPLTARKTIGRGIKRRARKDWLSCMINNYSRSPMATIWENVPSVVCRCL